MVTIVMNILRLIQRYIYSYEASLNVNGKIGAIRTFSIMSRFKQCPRTVRFGKICQLNGESNISIGERTLFSDYLFLTAWDVYREQKLIPKLLIGNDCVFGAFCHITCSRKIIIGDNCLFGKWITITDNSHGDTETSTLALPPSKRHLESKGDVIIGKNVWIGDKVTILPNVKIGDGAVVGANSVVRKDIPPYSVVAGNPAKIIKHQKAC